MIHGGMNVKHKKHRLIAVVLVLIVFFVGCGDGKVTLPDEEMISEDIKGLFAEKNDKLEIVSIEKLEEKSVAEDGEYNVTMNVAAQTRYADWNYTLELSYRNYDQGWILENALWTDGQYQVSRVPDAETMEIYVKEYINNHELLDQTSIEEYLENLSDSKVSYNDEVIQFSWLSRIDWLHATESNEVITVWDYNADIDNWDLRRSGDVRYDWYGYDIEINYLGVEVKPNLDYTGIWEGDGIINKFTIEISDFTSEGFNASIPSRNVQDRYFAKYEGEIDKRYILSAYSGEFYFDGEETFICIFHQPKATFIVYEKLGGSLQSAYVEEELPEIQ